MEHVVFHPGPDGAPAFRRFTSLEDAIRFVEHLRNAEGVMEVSVHTLTPVPVAFRAYYKVEMPAEPAAAAPVAEPVMAEPVMAEPMVEAVVEPMAEPMVEAVVEPVAEAVVEPVAEVPAPAAPVEPVMAEAQFAEAAAAAEQPSNGKRSLGFFAH